MAEVKKKPIRKTTKVRETALVSRVPAMEQVKDYVSRSVHGVAEEDVFTFALKNKQNILLEGHTGSGKTSAVLHFAAKNKMPFYSVPSNVAIDPTQLFGRFIPMPDGTFEWVDGGLTEIVRNGGVLLLDEINFMPERIASVLFGLLDKRREITLLDHKGEVVKAHEDLLIVGGMNPNYEGTRPLNKAFRNRFAIQIQWGYSSAVDEELIKSSALVDFMRSVRNGNIVRTPVSTNMIMEFQTIYWELGYKFARNNLVGHFLPVERDGVGRGIDTYKVNIEKELSNYQRNMLTGASTTVDEVVDNFDDLDLEGYIQSRYAPDHEIWDIRQNAPDGYLDVELGIKGKDWNL